MELNCLRQFHSVRQCRDWFQRYSRMYGDKPFFCFLDEFHWRRAYRRRINEIIAVTRFPTHLTYNINTTCRLYNVCRNGISTFRVIIYSTMRKKLACGKNKNIIVIEQKKLIFNFYRVRI